MLKKITHQTDINIDDEYEKLDKIEIAIDNQDNQLFKVYLQKNDIDVEGFVDGMKELWVRLKKILKHISNMSKRLWLRALIFVASSDEDLKKYRDKISNKLILEMKNKGEIKDIMKKYVLESSYDFISNHNTDTKTLFTKDDPRCKEIIKEIKNPDQKIIDYLTGKSNIEFIRFYKDTVTFIVKKKEGIDKDQYIKSITETINQTTFNKLENDMLDKIENNRFLKEIETLFNTVYTYDKLKDLIDDGFTNIKEYEDTANKLKIDDDSSLSKMKKEYDTLKVFSRFTYSTIRAEITKTKLAIQLGKLMFDED